MRVAISAVWKSDEKDLSYTASYMTGSVKEDLAPDKAKMLPPTMSAYIYKRICDNGQTSESVAIFI